LAPLAAFQAGRFAEALALVDQFMAAAAEGLDRGFFLRGQILEAKSPVQDIRGAVTAYRTLVSRYPASSLREQAQGRITFLSKFYFLPQ
jgi:outer membrane protein assembly factor BamD (BamD/ComL family)